MSNNKQQTAVDKAKELIEKFEQLINYTSQASRLCESTAKECALIEVDGILMAIQDLPIDNEIWDYWQQVKQEIQTYGGGNKVTTNSKLTNEESPTQTTSYKKFMDVFNLIKNKGEVNELGNGYILKNVETKILDGGMSRLIQWENFEAHMDYFNEITYKNGDENTLSNILVSFEKKITEMCKHNWETFDYDGERSIVYCTKCDKVKVKYHTLLRR